MSESIAYVVVTETHVNSTVSAANPSATPWTGLLDAVPGMQFAWPAGILYHLLVASVVVGFFVSFWWTRHLDTAEWWRERRLETRRAEQVWLWNTPYWWVLSLVVDQWLRGLLVGDGMWTPKNAQSLRDKKDKSAMRQLVRMGIFPLFIEDGGGPTTATVREGSVNRWGWPIVLSIFKQSKKRAVFEFVVPRARGWAIPDEEVKDRAERQRRIRDEAYITFVQMLQSGRRIRRATRWRVSATCKTTVRGLDARGRETRRIENIERWSDARFRVPSERGATSRFKLLLPFKMDRNLCTGYLHGRLLEILNYLVHGTLLTRKRLPVVRIEAPDDDEIELDKEILLIGKELGLDVGWDEDLARHDLRQAYEDNEMTLLE